MKKYYWLRLKNNFFTQREIKKLRNIAGGEALFLNPYFNKLVSNNL